MMPFRIVVAAGLLGLACGEEVCYSGFVMDKFCIDLGVLLDTGDETLRFPGRHSVHCLVDVPRCSESGFAILQDPNLDKDDEELYTPIVQLLDNENGTEKVLKLARQVGSCSTCVNGYNDTFQQFGFRATVIGTIVDNSTDPPTMQVSEIFNGDVCNQTTIEVEWSIQSYENMTANVGDSVVFSWEGLHNVRIHPTGTCDEAGAINVSDTSPATYMFTEPGEITFACDVGEHCEAGQVINFVVA